MAEKLFALSEDTKDKVLELIGRKPAPDKYANKTPTMREYYSRMWLVQLDEDLQGITREENEVGGTGESASETITAHGVDAYVMEKNDDDEIEQREWKNEEVKLRKQVYNATEETFPANDGNGKPIYYTAIQDMLGTIWIQPCPKTLEPEYFLINAGNDGTQTQVNDPSVYTKGSLHYIIYSATYNAWIPFSQNELTPATTAHARYAGTKLVVCQCDAPDSAAEYKMPYFTPESNMGVPPKFASSITIDGKTRCGVLMGTHEFTGGMWDYGIEAGGGINYTPTNMNGSTYFYQPQFMAYMEATGDVGGGNPTYVEINNVQYPVLIAYGGLSTGGLSAPNYPDIYPYDSILVEIDCQSQTALPVWIPTDYEALTMMAFYTAPGRGWDAMQTPQGMTDAGLTLYIKVKTGAIT